MNTNETKKFIDVKEGDFVYHVTSTNGYKTSIIKKKVTLVKPIKLAHTEKNIYVSIICESTSQWSWLDSYMDLPVDKSSVKNKNTEPKATYLCTTLEEAKHYCDKIVADVIEKNNKEIARLNRSNKQWKEHQHLLNEGVYTIK